MLLRHVELLSPHVLSVLSATLLSVVAALRSAASVPPGVVGFPNSVTQPATLSVADVSLQQHCGGLFPFIVTSTRGSTDANWPRLSGSLLVGRPCLCVICGSRFQSVCLCLCGAAML